MTFLKYTKALDKCYKSSSQEKWVISKKAELESFHNWSLFQFWLFSHLTMLKLVMQSQEVFIYCKSSLEKLS